jgi:1-acyl-sn-glycerol-3-phosphate acyltransferase
MSRPGALPLPLAASIPQFPQNPRRRLCGWILACFGWHMVGAFPDLPRAVLIAAPHSSWWDGVWGMLFKVALGIDIAFMGKRELFRGPLGWLLRQLGGFPIERHAAHGLVEQVARRFDSGGPFWIGIAPEGTRKTVARWRSGFWHIARTAGVPIVPVAFDYPSRSIVVGAPFMPGADLDADLDALRAFYAPFRGRNRGV